MNKKVQINTFADLNKVSHWKRGDTFVFGDNNHELIADMALIEVGVGEFDLIYFGSNGQKIGSQQFQLRYKRTK